MPSQINLKPTTLYTYGNKLTADQGSLVIADNCIIDQPDAIESRRGFFLYSQALEGSNDVVTQLMEYKGRLLGHIPGPDKIYFDSNTAGNFLAFDGTYTNVDSNRRMRYIEANGNFYFTTNDGIKKISVTAASDLSSSSGFIVRSGAPKATDLQLFPENTSPGFMLLNSAVAYRVVWGTKDSNNNLILGPPSENTQFFSDGVLYLIQDFNTFLASLDSAAQASTSDLLTSTDFLSSYVLPNNAPAEDLRINLISLAAKLDNNFQITNAVTAVSAQIDDTLATIYFNNSVSGNYLVLGDKIAIDNVSDLALTGLNSTTANPSWEIIEFPSASSIQFDIQASTTVALTSLIGAVINSYNFRNIQSSSSIIVGQPTGDQYSGLFNYYNSIVDTLNGSVSGFVDSSLQPVGLGADDSIQTLVKFSVPSEINSLNYTNWFYQIYRSAVFTAPTGLTLSDINPGDELNLVIEDQPTAAQVASSFVTVIDNTPDEFRGVGLYTNANSGEGILQSNDRPPVAKDIAVFKNSTFYANTRSNHSLNLTFLGVANFNTAISSSVTSLSLSANILTLQFNSPIALTSGNIISLSGFTGNSETLNTYYSVNSTNSNTAILSSSISGTFTDSSTADFGTIYKSETLTINRGAFAEVFTFIPAEKERTKFIFSSASTLSTGSTATYLNINSAENEHKYYVDFLVGSATSDPAPSGRTRISISAASSESASSLALKFVDILKTQFDFNSENTFSDGATAYIENYDYGDSTNSQVITATAGITASTIKQGFIGLPSSGYVALFQDGTPSQNIFDTSKNFLTILNRTPSGMYQGFYISGINDTPGKLTIQAEDYTEVAFHLNVSSTAMGNSFDPTIPLTGGTVASNNTTLKNGLYYSKLNQPEAVPNLVNFQRVGQQDKEILRIVPLRDSLFILKEEGVYRLGGDNPANFSIFLFDTGAKLICADSAAPLNNQIYCWTTQGVVNVSDSGVEILSRPIENELNKLLIVSNFAKISHGVNYDLDRSYFLWLPEKEGDEVATQCFRFNFLTRAWTRWPIEKTAAHVLSSDNKMYLGAGDTNFIEKERKSFDRIDYADREFTRVLGPNSLFENRIILDAVDNIEMDDVLAQQQYITLNQYNSLLFKLDNDPGVISISANDYISSISAAVGDSIATDILKVAQKLDSDFGFSLSSANAVSSVTDNAASTHQTAYNYITTQLNAATALSFSNYPTVSGYVLYESVIDTVSSTQISLTSNLALPLIQGSIIIYKHIAIEAQWVPQHFGNPSILKHVRESSLMFESSNFKRAKIAFSSDLLPSFEEIPFEMEGDGIFGYTSFGNGFFGGGGNQRPLRTYLPPNKQRCRFINVKFKHTVARSKWTLYGVSLVGEMNTIENKAYK